MALLKHFLEEEEREMKTTTKQQTTQQQTTKHKQTTKQANFAHTCGDSSNTESTSSDASSIHGDEEVGVLEESQTSMLQRSDSGDGVEVEGGCGEVGEGGRGGRTGDKGKGESGDGGLVGVDGCNSVSGDIGDGDGASCDVGDSDDGVTGDVRRKLEREHLTDSSDDLEFPTPSAR